MFESLSGRLDGIWKRLRGHGRLTPQDVDEALREVRLALLEADVHFKVAKDFVASVREKAIGDDVLQSLTPAQQVVKIVHDELTALMGGSTSRLALASQPPTVVLLCGLQGAGKTTTAAKLAVYIGKQNRRTLLVAADLARPAAVEQLRLLGEQTGVPVVTPKPGENAVTVAERGVSEGRAKAVDMVVVDTQGRSQIADDLMEELRSVRDRVHPHEVLLVLDAMAGQDAATVATGFQEGLGFDGVVLSRLDGDARGGAALSVRALTGRPIKFVGTGERPEALEEFHPERMASRILGMGDVLSLIERAEAAMDQGQAQEMQRRLLGRGELTLDDFLHQMQALRKMGPLEQVLSMVPGLNAKALRDVKVDESELSHMEAIVRSMTPRERQRPEIIDGSRRRRIAGGSGTAVHEVNQLLRRFEDAKKMIRSATQGGIPRLPGPMGIPHRPSQKRRKKGR